MENPSFARIFVKKLLNFELNLLRIFNRQQVNFGYAKKANEVSFQNIPSEVTWVNSIKNDLEKNTEQKICHLHDIIVLAADLKTIPNLKIFLPSMKQSILVLSV